MATDRHSPLHDVSDNFTPPGATSSLSPITSSADNQAHAQMTKSSEGSSSFSQFPSKEQLLHLLSSDTEQEVKNVPNLPSIKSEQSYINSGQDPNAARDQQQLNSEIAQVKKSDLASEKVQDNEINSLSGSDLHKIGTLVNDMQDGNIAGIKQFVEGYKNDPSALRNLLDNDGGSFGLAMQLKTPNDYVSEGYSYDKQGKLSALNFAYGGANGSFHNFSTNG